MEEAGVAAGPSGPQDAPLPLFHVTCVTCTRMSRIGVSGARIVLYSHGVTVLEFFCPRCREFNRAALDPKYAEAYTKIGVPTSVERVPEEMLEHPPAGCTTITSLESAVIPSMSDEVFNRLAQQELGL